MPRKARKYVNASFFHVMCQGIKKENIFSKESHIKKYLYLINKYKKDFFIDIIAYCVMPNHVHLLLHSHNVAQISKFMHKINCIYGMHYNSKNKRVGYVFRDRFRMEEINNDKYLMTCIFYIHNNPVKAGICTLVQQYKYSSYKEFFGTPKLINKQIVGEIIGDTPYEQLEKETAKYNIQHLDIDVSNEVRAQEIILNFATQNNKTIPEILANYKTKRELLIELHVKNKVSYRCIEKVLPIKRRIIPNYLYDQKGQV